MSQPPAIRTEALGRVYKISESKKDEPKELVALGNVNLEIEAGELFGLLGPNGAGKTTLIKVLTTLLAPTSGHAWVVGFDVFEQADQIRPRINMVSGGESSGYGLLTVRENLWMFSQFYGIPSKEADATIRRLLEVVGLEDKINTKTSDLSTGMRQKMNVVRGFMTDPSVIFLDEPSVGLDVGAARDVRQFVRNWFEVFLPLLAVSAYVFIYQAIGAPAAYVGFVIVGGAMTAFWVNVQWTMSSQWFWEKEMGNLALYTIAPASLMAILLGMALGGMTATLLRAGAIILLGAFFFDVQFTVSSYGLLFLTFSLTMIALYGLGMMLSSVFLLLNREAWHLANLAQEPVYLASGFYFPIRSFGFWIALGASFLPMTLGLDAMRQLFFPVEASLGFLSVPVELTILAVLAVVFLICARYLLSYMERLAIREGRLTGRTR